MKSRLFLFFSIILLTNTLFAQKEATIWLRPIEYDNPNNDILPSHVVKKGSGQFIVMSDRIENPVYESASKGTVLRTLKFLDPLFVIGEEGAFFKVAEYSEENKIVGNVLKNPKNIGYVEKTNLILWKSAIQNDKGFVKKALSVVKGEVLVNKGEFMSEKGEIKCFSYPSQNSKYLLSESGLRIFKFLFIVKESADKKMVLLAHGSAFSVQTKDRIIGWVPKEIVQIWEDRLCFEPNFSEKAIDERRLAGIYPALLVSNESVKKFQKNPQDSDIEDIISLDTLSRKPWGPERKRLPMLNYNKEDKICETGYTTAIVNSSGEGVIHDTTWERLTTDINKRKILLRNINIVFVIDGSNALSQYMSSVTNAISSLKKDFSPELKNLYSIRYGAVVYRNNEDVNCPNYGNISISKNSLTNQYSDVLDFIDRESKITGCNDNIYSKALYNGIYEGLNMFNTKRGVFESNYMILIGGAGEKMEDDAKNAQTLQKIIDLYVKTGVNMFAYQYRRLGKEEFRGFTSQVQNILQKGNEGILSSAKDVVNGEAIKPINWERLEKEGIYSYKAVENKTFVKYAEFTWPPVDKNIPEESFLRDMDGFLRRATSKSNENIKQINAAFLLGQKVDLTNELRVLLKGVDTQVNESKIVEAFKGQNSQFFGRCYLPVKVTGLKEDLFSRVYFYTDDELSDLVKVLSTLSISLDDIELSRKMLHQTLVEIAKGYIGKSDAASPKTMDLKKLLLYVVGKDPKQPIFYTIKTLDDILDVKKVKDEDIRKLGKEFSSKYSQLKQLYSSDSNSNEEDSDLRYFWVPENKLP